MADKDFPFSRENFSASEGDSSISEDPQQLVERLLLTEPAGDGAPRQRGKYARWRQRWVEAYLEYHDQETAWVPAAETRAERWVEAYLAYHGEGTVWPGSSGQREPWVQAYLAYYGMAADGLPTSEPHSRHGERWVQEYLAYYDQERIESSGPAVGVPLLKAASHG